MAIQCGIVGLPNVGKSTLFNALTNAGIDAANYPFCTIEPNVGRVNVPDTRLDPLVAIVKPERVQQTYIDFVDIAGLVAGASQGEGLGNQFLANIRETDAIAHVVRCFENDDIVHVAGQINPIDDIEVINTELSCQRRTRQYTLINRHIRIRNIFARIVHHRGNFSARYSHVQQSTAFTARLIFLTFSTRLRDL